MKKSVEIEQVENGFKVMTRKEVKKQDEKGNEIYPDWEHKEYIAKDLNEAMTHMDAVFGTGQMKQAQGKTILGGSSEQA